MAKRKSKGVAKKVAPKSAGVQKKNKMPLAIVALILNLLILPGLGSLIAGKTKVGIWQIIIAIIGIILSFVLIGIPILIVVWIWGVVTGVKLIQEAQ